LLGPVRARQPLAFDQHFDLEQLVVIGAQCADEAILGQRQIARLQQLLQRRFVVLPRHAEPPRLLEQRARARDERRARSMLEEARRLGVAGQDYKSALQELLQARDLPLPEYRLVGTLGPDHNKLFEIEVLVKGERLAARPGRARRRRNRKLRGSPSRACGRRN